MSGEDFCGNLHVGSLHKENSKTVPVKGGVLFRACCIYAYDRYSVSHHSNLSDLPGVSVTYCCLQNS